MGLFCCIGFVLILSNMNGCSRINSTVQIIEHREALRTSNALEILSQYPLGNTLINNSLSEIKFPSLFHWDLESREFRNC